MKREVIEEEKLYWDGKPTKQDRKRSAQVQLILENQNGILCFHCKQFVLEQYKKPVNWYAKDVDQSLMLMFQLKISNKT